MSASIVKKLHYQKQMVFNQVEELEQFLDSTVTWDAKDVDAVICLRSHTEKVWASLADIKEELVLEHEVDIEEDYREYSTRLWKACGHVNSLQRPVVTSESTPHSSESQFVKLPPLEIPSFSGRYEDWTTFRDTFTSLVHDNPSIAKVQKFFYLQGALKGEAASILRCLSASNNGYDVAWEQLTKRYQNERFIIKKHVRTLLKFPTMKSANDSSLRHLIDTVSVTLSALRQLGRPVTSWDDLLIEILSDKLDENIRRKWESDMCEKVPTFREFETFLSLQCKQLEANRLSDSMNHGNSKAQHHAKVLHVTDQKRCALCSRDHMITTCNQFLKLSTIERIEAVRRSRICYKCLKKGHFTSQCQKSEPCERCTSNHHTLLHRESTAEPPSTSQNVNPNLPSTSNPTVVNITYTPSRVLLSTCKVLIKDKHGCPTVVRAMLDTGAQANLITTSCARRLGLKQFSSRVSIVGVGGTTETKRVVSTEVISRVSHYSLHISALVIDKITGKIPARPLAFDDTVISDDYPLADPEFAEPQEVELLIGNSHYHDIVLKEQLKINKISLLSSQFGWIVYGELPYKYDQSQPSTVITHMSVNEILIRFWELESHKHTSLAPADAKCETYFKETVSRDTCGRFEVALPFKDSPSLLGNSSESAKKRFFALERRLTKTPAIYQSYREFMKEYVHLGHMRPSQGNTCDGYYLPHHCVLKASSLTTKLRVVFNGSAPSSTGKSLNDLLMTGPAIQNDLFAIMSRMRCWKFVVTADIAKMYRQFKIRPQDQKYQRIWWRNSPEEELTSYELTTVTYGTASAAFLAIRALRELAERERLTYPIGSDKCLSDFYVDDMITGADSLPELKIVRDQVSNLLASGGLELKRWASNNADLFVDFKTECVDEVTVLTRDSESANERITTLGTVWNTKTDTIAYNCNIIPNRATTKRSVLSEVSRVYDPLGLVGPITITGKIFIQDLWKLHCGWDDPLPDTYLQRWLDYADNLANVALITIPRMVIHDSHVNIEIHGFSDASEQAYGACIYVVGIQDGVGIFSNLLCAKSRVAPVKATSIPRLELCAAVLLVELYERVRTSLQRPSDRVIFYTDSTITLSWIKSESRKFKTFVANRIGEIHKLSNPSQWYHVSSKENPADMISRGANATQLKDCEQWWNGPAFLLSTHQQDEFVPEENPPEVKCTITIISEDDVVLPHCSTFNKTVRVVAYVLRFTTRLKSRCAVPCGPLTIRELQTATTVLISAVQRVCFNKDIEHLKTKQCVDNKSKLIKLNPFIDEAGLIRVGGRLALSDLPASRRCPIVLPSSHQITKLLITDYHRTNVHAGVQGTLSAIRQSFWPLAGRNSVRGVIRACIRCIRARPNFNNPVMGTLPSYRVRPSRPFKISGVDYCGPFTIKEGSRRSRRTTKAYICIFVCCSTKATHIELVSSLSTECFLAAFRRFISRRGNVSEIISDNATNFVGARNHLRELGLFLNDANEEITTALTAQQINWRFIPPRAPHFGGLSEAAVKNVKTHLHRVAGKSLLTVEELLTLLAQIESVLNSRPLCPMSDDPNDIEALTPGHFLIGEAMNAPADPDYKEVPDNRLSRWQLIQKMRQNIWKRWSREYLSEMHARSKWNVKTDPPQLGQLVIIKEDNLPPLQWQLGRILEIHHGPDGIIRCAKVRTSSTNLVRPVVKLCLLPRE